MSLDRAIKAGKEKRAEYRGAKACDATCRNNGSCSYCRANRLYKFEKREQSSRQEEEAYKRGEQ